MCFLVGNACGSMDCASKASTQLDPYRKRPNARKLLGVLHCANIPGECLLSVTGEFGAAELSGMERLLRSITPGSRITLDFSHAQQLQEFAIGSMAPMLETIRGSVVRVRGLGRHHLRILAYMGVHLAQEAEDRVTDDA